MLLGWIEITVLILVILLLVFRVGYRQWTKQMQMTEIAFQKVKSSFPEAQWTGSISYQGGLPEYPKPSLMNLALDTQQLILFKEDERDGTQWTDHGEYRIGRSERSDGADDPVGEECD